MTSEDTYLPHAYGCTITLEDVTYHLGLPIDGESINGCLSNFPRLMEEGGRPPCDWIQELLGQILPVVSIDKMSVMFSWFVETFLVLPPDMSDELVLRHARAYIIILWSTQLFDNKTAT
ncbi:hypothetical protein PIB30_083590 [Stylosanthes scabra]|uniref:Aminotransferase-like plant mobile domain-containing protein n=1 Tax=Stylosanthes scabra TaxID=79078 RepID=A0ABU6QTK1_9FABA|nr:hypothetical protein [Stylosanthes scabra]